MGTWTELTAELSACERNITAIRLKTQEKVDAEQKKVHLISIRREEMLTNHGALQDELAEEHDARMQNCGLKCEQEVAQATEQREQAQRRLEDATAKAEQAEQRSRDLEQQVKELHAIFDRKELAHNRHVIQVRDISDATVALRMKDADESCIRASLYAMDVQEGAVHSVDMMTTEQKLKLADAEAVSAQRSRCRELTSLAMSRHPPDDSQELPEPVFQKSRLDLCQGWHDEWVDHMENLERSFDQLANYSHMLKDDAPNLNRPRSKDKNRQKAQERITAWRRAENDGAFVGAAVALANPP